MRITLTMRMLSSLPRSFNADFLSRHPVYNEYVPIQFRGDVFLRKEGDMEGKIWDEDALTKWELEENEGKEWEGRKSLTKDS